MPKPGTEWDSFEQASDYWAAAHTYGATKTSEKARDYRVEVSPAPPSDKLQDSQGQAFKYSSPPRPPPADHFHTAPAPGDRPCNVKGSLAPPPPAPPPPRICKDASVAELLLPAAGAWDQRPTIERCVQQLRDVEGTLAAVRASLADVTFSAGGTVTPAALSPARVGRTMTETVESRPSLNVFSTSPAMLSTPAKSDSQQALETHSVHSKWADRDPGKKPPVVVDQVIVSSVEELNAQRQASERLRRDAHTYSRDILWVPLGRGQLRCIQVPMFHPDAKARMAWAILGFVFIIYEAYAIPVYLAFEVKPRGALYIFISVINSYFIMDIVVQFFSCYMNKHNSIVYSPRLVAKHYLLSWCIFDVIAGIPWEWLDAGDGSLNRLTRGVRLIRAARMMRILRIMRVMKLKSVMEHLEPHLEANHFFMFLTGVLKILALLFAVCHWGACLWYAIGRNNADKVHFDGSPASWVAYHQTSAPYIGDERFSHYVVALYFVLTTMTTVGYGDITPTCFNEVIFTMVLLLTSSVVFAGLMGTLTDMISALNAQTRELQEKKMMLSRYMKWRVVPRRLMLTIRQHLLFLWDANKGYDAYEEGLKVELPPVLKAELCHHIYGSILRTAPFLGWMKDFAICTKFLSERVRSIFLERNDIIFRMGQHNDQVYILLTGEVVATRNESLFAMDASKGEDAKPSMRGGFDIPRNTRDASLEVDQVKSSIPSTVRATLSSTRIGGKVGAGGGANRSKVSSSKSFGLPRTGNSFLDSEVLLLATVELKKEDVRMSMAAKRLQRVWRRRLALRHLQHAGRKAASQKGIKISRMTSKNIQAPAYFGESCLWQAVDEWDTPPSYMYTTRCACRSETIYISRASILEMLDRFSPWLPERLAMFRQVVVDKMHTLLGADAYREWDFSLADVAMPDNDIGMQDTQIQAIKRADPAGWRDCPAKPRDELPNSHRMGAGLRRTPSNLGISARQKPSVGMNF